MAFVRSCEPTTLAFMGIILTTADDDFEIRSYRIRDSTAETLVSDIGFGVADKGSRERSRTGLVRPFKVSRLAANLALLNTPILHKSLPSLHAGDKTSISWVVDVRELLKT